MPRSFKLFRLFFVVSVLVLVPLLAGSNAAMAACSDEDPDNDGDGFCASQDCADNNPNVNPGAEEACDGREIDEDCDGFVDEADPDCGAACSETNPDADGDGYCASEDCDDTREDVFPGAEERCAGGVDEDCDRLVDSADPDCGSSGCSEEDPDVDEDGFCASVDCDDTDPLAYPGAEEICDEGNDEDCDGLANEADPDCQPCNEEDPDGDGDGFCASADCNDADPAINPDADEICDGAGVDEDCDTRVDSLDPDCGAGACPDENGGTPRSWVYFVDKGVSEGPEMESALSNAAAGLSDRARERRILRRTAPGLVDARDLPVAKSYVAAIEKAGARVRHVSRWLNSVSVVATPDVIEHIRALPFVLSVEPVRGAHRDNADRLVPVGPTSTALSSSEDPLDHGLSEQQLSMIGVTDLHNAGYTGAGVVVGVLDTGFVTTHTAFQDPEHPLRVRAAWDFVDDDSDPGFQLGDHPRQHEHGTIILGTIGAYAPGTYVGGAFDAEFILAKTENVACEVPAEEDDYVAGLEFSERNGADVVTSSLSYSNWYTQSEMDGKTAVTSIAVSIAALNGVHCVTGAGNKGHDADPSTSHLGAPADAFRVLTVGAVGITGETPGFTSDGPTADGRVKPEVMAVGSQAWSVHPNSDTEFATYNGTSMSTPQVTGAVACLVQAHPEWTVDEMRTYLMASGSVYRATGTFDPFYVEGYGLVNGLGAESGDCDASGVRDRIEIDAGLLPDCDGNRVPDSCDLRFGTYSDRNSDGIPDVCKRLIRRPGKINPSKFIFRGVGRGGDSGGKVSR